MSDAQVLALWAHIMEGSPERVPNGVPILHHYTDAIGLHGIVSSHELRASAAQFSNDLSEIHYAHQIASSVIEEVWTGGTGARSGWEEIIREHVQLFFSDSLSDFNEPFLVSFCEEGNLLSQWRAYGRRSGFSLGFQLRNNDADLMRCKNGARTLLRKVVYSPVDQKERLTFLLKKFIELVDTFTITPAADESAGHDIYAELIFLLFLEMADWVCTVKHKDFFQEQEWRLITFPTFNWRKSKRMESVMIRATPELLIPYMVLRPAEGNLLPLTEIRCGPSSLQSELARAAEILLSKEGYGSVPIHRSEVPLRI